MKFACLSLGCKVNQCETEALAKVLREDGYTLVPFEEKADVYLINTCCVTAEGERKSRQMVRRAHRINPQAKIVVTGCAVQKEPSFFSTLEGVTLTAGNAHKADLPALIRAGKSGTFVSDMTHFCTYRELPDALIEHTRAFLKIQDGCNNFCSYCIIPYMRGRECSRPEKSITAQAEEMARRGFKELVLTGIHLSSYGKEWGYKPDLAAVVESVCAIDGILRVRLGSLEPMIITDDFLRRVTAQKKFCRQYHLSLQAGCDAVLKRMNRHYTVEQYRQAVRLIRQNDPYSAISTDIIVGFPGETDDEFLQTLAFADEVGFAWVHVFPYSVREGTVAASLPGQVSKQVKQERAEKLSALCREKGRQYRAGFVGQVKEILCLKDESGCYGLTKEHIPVFFGGAAEENQILTVRITGVTENGLSAVVIESNYKGECIHD